MAFRDETTEIGQAAIKNGFNAEEEIADFFRKNGWSVRLNVELEPGWDLELVNSKGQKFYVEVKSSAGIDRVTGYVYSTGNLQGNHGKRGGGKEMEGWRDPNNKTTHLMMYNRLTKTGYLYKVDDARKWYDRRLRLEDEECWPGASSTTWGFRIKWEEPVWSIGKSHTINVGER